MSICKNVQEFGLVHAASRNGLPISLGGSDTTVIANTACYKS